MLDVNLSPLLGKKKDAKFGRCHSQEIDICAKYVMLYTPLFSRTSLDSYPLLSDESDWK